MKKLLIISTLLFSLTTKAQFKYSDSDRKEKGWVITTAGLSFTTAAILETSYQYGTYQKDNTGKEVYYIKEFFKQTPRQIMLVVGVSMTITGLFTLKNK